MKQLKRMLILMLLLLFAAHRAAAGEAEKELSEEKTCSLTIFYTEGSDGTGPVSGALFVCYKVAAYETEVSPLGFHAQPVVMDAGGVGVRVDTTTRADHIEEAVHEAYAAGRTIRGAVYRSRTGSDGRASFTGMEEGIYLVEEESPARFHLPSASFLVSLPSYTDGTCRYDVTAEPKPEVTGELLIRKRVEGNAGEKKRLFHFKIDVTGSGSYAWERSDGVKGTISSGGVLTLKHGESVRVFDLPEGRRYQVTEQEAGLDGYKTKSTGTSGKIKGKEQAVTDFVNTRETETVPTLTPVPKGKNTVTEPVRTGDSSSAGSYLLLFATAAAVSVFLLKGIRKV